MSRKEQIFIKNSDIYVAKYCRLSEAKRHDTAAQIRRHNALLAQCKSGELFVQAGVPEEEQDLCSAIIVRQAIRAVYVDTRMRTQYLKYSGDELHYRIELERLRTLSKRRASEKALRGETWMETIIYLPEKERDAEDGKGG